MTAKKNVFYIVNKSCARIKLVKPRIRFIPLSVKLFVLKSLFAQS